MDRANLEAQLRTHWTRANLASYGAHLRQSGDPRGELVELDLEIARDGSSAARVARREALLGTLGLARFDKSEVAYGFVDELRLHELTIEGPATVFEVFAATPMAPYLRGLRLSGEPKFVRRELEALAAVVYPWLWRITIALMAPATVRPPIGKALASRLRTAAPALARIEALRFHQSPIVAGDLGAAVQIVRDPPEPRRLVIDLGGHRETVELGRLARLHAGIVEQLSRSAREAWAELRFAIDQRVPRGPTSLPAAVLADALAELDPALYYASDWDPIRARLAGIHEVTLGVEG